MLQALLLSPILACLLVLEAAPEQPIEVGNASLVIQLEGQPSYEGFEVGIERSGDEGKRAKPQSFSLAGSARMDELQPGTFLVMIHGEIDGLAFMVKDSVYIGFGEELLHTVEVPSWDVVPFSIQVTDRGKPLAEANIVQSGLPHNLRFRIGETDSEGRLSGKRFDVPGSFMESCTHFYLVDGWGPDQLLGRGLDASDYGLSVGQVKLGSASKNERLRLDLELCTLELFAAGLPEHDWDKPGSSSYFTAVFLESDPVGVVVARVTSPSGAKMEHLPPGTYRVLVQLAPGKASPFQEVELDVQGARLEFDLAGIIPALLGFAGIVDDEVLHEFDIGVWRTGQKSAEVLPGSWGERLWVRFLTEGVEHIDVLRPDGAPLGRLQELPPLREGLALDFDFATRRLRLMLPKELEVLDGSRLSIQVQGQGEQPIAQRIVLADLLEGEPATESGVKWRGRKIEMGRLAPGIYEFRVAVEIQYERKGRIRWKRSGSYLRVTRELKAGASGVWTLE